MIKARREFRSGVALKIEAVAVGPRIHSARHLITPRRLTVGLREVFGVVCGNDRTQTYVFGLSYGVDHIVHLTVVQPQPIGRRVAPPLWDGLAGTIDPDIGVVVRARVEITTEDDDILRRLRRNLCADLASLELLSLGDNGFAGPIPPSLGNLRCVVELNLSSNCLEGCIPPELGGLEHLKFLDLHENQLSGEIPGELGNATNLERLYLHNNDLTGEVPRALGALIHLKYAYLHNNPLTISPKMPTDAQGELSFRTEGETLTFVAYLRSDEASCACALM